jgi:hypothetical protein
MVVPEGEASLADIEHFFGKRIPETLTQTTGSGGRHYLFRYPEGTGGDGSEVSYGNRASLAPSVDIRGEGGYIVAPPSVHHSGNQYRWDDEGFPLAEAPLWVLGARDEDHAGYIERDEVGEGGRNDHLYRYACKLRGEGQDRGHMVALVQEMNKAVCKPPLDDREVLTIVNSAMKYQPNQEAMLDWQDDDYDTEEDDELPELHDGEDLVISLTDLLSNPPKLLDPIVGYGVMDEMDGWILGGQPNVGKSWLAFDLALAMAGGDKWLDYFPTVQGTVLIVDEEGSLSAMYKRMVKLMEGRGIAGLDLPVMLSVGKGNKFSDPKGLIAVKRMMDRVKPNLVIFDSLVRMHDGDENSNRDMSRFFEVSSDLKRNFDSAVMFLHHLRKPSKEDAGDVGDLLRGAGDIRGWPDGVMVASPIKGDMGMTELKLTHVKSREHAKLPDFHVGMLIDEQEAVMSVKDRDRDKLDYHVGISFGDNRDVIPGLVQSSFDDMPEEDE